VLYELRAQVVLPPHQTDWVGGSVDDALLEAAELPEGNPWPGASTATACMSGSWC
jgi:hypothetical protein